MGYELVTELDLAGHARGLAEEAVALLSAPQCPSLVTTVVIDATQLALQVHESCGHPIELDRVFGTEASYAGTSFLTTEKLGSFRYGSDLVNITADATIPGGLGTFGYDDEGVPAQRTPIVRHVAQSVGLRYLPRDGGPAGAYQQRRHARRWLESHPYHPHDQRQPGAGGMGIRRSDR